MQTDSLFYRLFLELPSVYFEAIGQDASLAREYQFTSEEIKETAVRGDGIFVPTRPDLPVHFVEVYFYKAPNAFANLLRKAGLWLDKKDPAQDWRACLFFASRSLEPREQQPYREWLDSGRIARVYLDELPTPRPDQFGLGLLEILVAQPSTALNRAKQLFDHNQATKKPGARPDNLLQLLQTVVLYRFPKLTRAEFETMFQLNDLRKSIIYQEALAEGREEGIEQGLERGLERGREEGFVRGRDQEREALARRMLREKYPLDEIASLTGLTLSQVKKLKRKDR